MSVRFWSFAPIAVALLLLADHAPAPLLAQGQDAGLTGTVTSAEEGAMEGVLVSVKKTGSKVTTTVVSDREGRYRVPRARLEPGTYAVGIRAIGYDLASSPTA